MNRRTRTTHLPWLMNFAEDSAQGNLARATDDRGPIASVLHTLFRRYHLWAEFEMDGDSFLVRLFPLKTTTGPDAFPVALCYEGKDLHRILGTALTEAEALVEGKEMYFCSGREHMRWVA